jgi:hypothetical protein
VEIGGWGSVYHSIVQGEFLVLPRLENWYPEKPSHNPVIEISEGPEEDFEDDDDVPCFRVL